MSRLEQHRAQFGLDVISWSNKDEFEKTFSLAIAEFFTLATQMNSTWTIYWCAGVGSPNRGGESIALEVVAVEYLAHAIRRCPKQIADKGTVFFSSSAGGLYGGALTSPVDETLPLSPWSDYGKMKKKLEDGLCEAAEISGCRLALGRFSNVYGPGQNFRKSQGLITQACISLVARQPLEIYVPLGTIRNYIYVEDAARVAIALTQFVSKEPPSTIVKKVICSDANLSISAVLYEVTRVFGRRPPVVLTTGKDLSNHFLDLSMKSNVLKCLEPRTFVLPAIGIAEVRRDLMSAVRQGRATVVRSNT